MTLNLLSKQQLQIINGQTLKYSLAEAEKDYFLTVVSKIIYESELGKKIVFKGGQLYTTATYLKVVFLKT